MDDTLADPIAGRLIDGRYAVSARIAHGGMATVYLATDMRLDRRVALKVMHAELARDDDFVRRFIDEAKSVARLSHHNVVAVYDQGADGPFLYLAMEYVPGQTLKEVLRSRGRFSPGAALDIMTGVLDGLASAHASGIVHRDVKPENVLITADGRVKVADFGLARTHTATGHTRSGMIIGTVAYLAPEQVTGTSPTGPQSDVYAAGVLLYELLTGRQPFTGETPIQVAYQHVNSDVPPPSALVPELPAPVDRLVLAATARDPGRRLADARQFLRAIRQVQDELSLSRSTSGQTGEHSGLTGIMGVGVRGMTEAPWLDFDGSSSGRVSNPAAWPQAQGNHTLPPAESAFTSTGEFRMGGYGGESSFTDAGGGGNHTLIVRQDDRYAGGRESFLGRWLFSRRLIVIIVALAIVLGAGLGGWWLTSGRYATVPSVANDTVSQATGVLTSQGFQVAGAQESQPSNSVPKGMVLGTAPSGRTSKGAKIVLIVSSGPFTSKVPAVTGETQATAQSDMRKAHLSTVIQLVGSSQPKGTVISTSPKAGTVWQQTKPVTLKVAGGPPLPNFVNEQFQQAQQQAAQDGITLQASGNQSDPGQITGQNQAPGSIMHRGEIVTVSVQANNVTIPYVIGFSVSEAKRILTGQGFKVQLSGNFGIDNFGSVWNESPDPGEQVPMGSTITLDVNLFGRGNNGNGKNPGF